MRNTTDKIDSMIEEWRNGDYSSLMGAIYNFGFAPDLVADEDKAKFIVETILSSGAEYNVCAFNDIEDKKMYCHTCSCLDIYFAEQVVYFVVKGKHKSLLVCFEEDYSNVQDEYVIELLDNFMTYGEEEYNKIQKIGKMQGVSYWQYLSIKLHEYKGYSSLASLGYLIDDILVEAQNSGLRY